MRPPRTLLKTLARHREMVDDPFRTPLIKAAIERALPPDGIVADLGSGLGILSFIAANAGAKRVFGIETEKESFEVSDYFNREFDLTHAITFYHRLSQQVALPEKVDLLICEIIGSLAFEENFLSTLLDARKRFLKKGGKIIPKAIELWGALVDDTAPPIQLPNWAAVEIAPLSLLSQPKRLVRIESAVFTRDNIKVKHEFNCDKKSILNGISLWPKIEWAEDLWTDASPFSPLTHWKQGYLPLPPSPVKKGEVVGIELHIGPDPENPRTKTEVLWRRVPASSRR